jgi:glutamyl-tRNA reductase
MELRALNVLHWRGAGLKAPPRDALSSADAGSEEAFFIDTCQRRMALVLDAQALPAVRRRFPADGALEHFQGTAAYTFLLRCCCGLESKLSAETEIFGQIKQAWRLYSDAPSSLGRRLNPWMQQLFQDAREIRAQFLTNLGGASYGSEVRRLLGEQAANGPTLLLGAGQLAQSVAPWLIGSELWIWNRTRARAQDMATELAKRMPERPVQVVEEHLEAQRHAWRRAAQVVICVPPDPLVDHARVNAWRERGTEGGRIVHLGAGVDGVMPWKDVPECVGLGTLFGMLQNHSNQRSRQIERARGACHEKAVLRSLGANSSHPHSWEDLAAFSLV